MKNTKHNTHSNNSPHPHLPEGSVAKPGTYVVVINSFNRPIELVERSLFAALGQEIKAEWVIFIDQNNTPLTLNEEITKNPIFKRFHSDKKCVSAARNSLKVPKDVEWIVFCDDDGYLHPDYSKRFKKIIAENPTLEILAGSIVREDNHEYYTPRHQLGGSLKNFRHSKLLMGSNLAVKAATFKKLEGFDEKFGAGSYWGSGEETDFCWKAFFNQVPMEFFAELIVYHVKPYAASFFNSFLKAFSYGKGKGALVSKWLFGKKKVVVLFEFFEMFLVPLLQVFTGLLRLNFKIAALQIAVIAGRIYGFVLSIINQIIFKDSHILPSKKVMLITARADIGGGPKAVMDFAQTIFDQYPQIELFMAAPDHHYFSHQYKNICKQFIPIPHRRLSLFALIKIVIFCKKNNIQIIHSHGRGAGYYSRLMKFFNFKIIHTLHGCHQSNDKVVKFKNWIDAKLANLTDQFISVSKQEYKIATKLNVISPEKTKIIPNGIYLNQYNHLDECDVKSLQTKWNQQKGDIILGSLTRFDMQKGNDILLKHFFELVKATPYSSYKLVLAGDGNERSNLEKLIFELNIQDKVYLLGNIEQPGIFLHAIDIYVSASRGEGLPISVIEAMSARKKCILSRVSGHIDLVNHGQTFKLFSSHEFIEKITDNSTKLVYNLKKYDISVTTKKLIKLYF